MKAYKSDKANQQVREIVHHYMNGNDFGNIKYWSNQEFEDSLVPRYGISSSMAQKVRQILRADAWYDDIALKVWGFNKHTA